MQAKRKAPIRGATVRLIQLRGKKIRVRSLVALAQACGVARITIKRQWEPAGVLPEPTLKDESGARWYSDSYIRAAVEVVTAYHRRVPRGHRRLEDLKQIFHDTWHARKIA